jgi:hypothetical protein
VSQHTRGSSHSLLSIHFTIFYILTLFNTNLGILMLLLHFKS